MMSMHLLFWKMLRLPQDRITFGNSSSTITSFSTSTTTSSSSSTAERGSLLKLDKLPVFCWHFQFHTSSIHLGNMLSLSCCHVQGRPIRRLGPQINVLFLFVRVAGWIELFQALHKCLDSNDLYHGKFYGCYIQGNVHCCQT